MIRYVVRVRVAALLGFRRAPVAAAFVLRRVVRRMVRSVSKSRMRRRPGAPDAVLEVHAPRVVCVLRVWLLRVVVSGPSADASRGGFREQAVVYCGVRVCEPRSSFVGCVCVSSVAVVAAGLLERRARADVAVRRGRPRGVFSFEQREGLAALGGGRRRARGSAFDLDVPPHLHLNGRAG